MTCIKLGRASGHGMICYQPDYKIMDRSGKVWYFEFHPYCGPSVLKKDGNPTRNQPTEKSPFWDAFQAWFDQGKLTEQRNGETWAKWGHQPGE